MTIKAEAKYTIRASDKTKLAVKSAKDRLKSFTGVVFSAKSAVASLVGVGGFGALVTSSLKAGDSLAKTADKLGLTTEALAGMRHAAELSGVAQNTLDMAIQRMTRRLSEAAMGTGEAQGALRELGLDAQALAAMAPDKAFQRIAGAMENVTTQGDRVRLSFKLFDSEGVSLVNTLAMGQENLQAAAAEADALGLSISRIDAAKMEMANDTFTRLKASSKGLGNAIAVNVAPFVEALGEMFVNAGKEAGGMSNFVGEAMNGVISAVGFVADAFRGLEVVWAGLNVAWSGVVMLIAEGIAGIDRNLTDILNKFSIITGKVYENNEAIQEWASSAGLGFEVAKFKLADLANAEMPSENVKRWAGEVRHEAQTAAVEIAKTRAALTSGGTDETGGVDVNKQERALASLETFLTGRVEKISQSLMTENEVRANAYAMQHLQLEEALARDFITQERYAELSMRLEAHKNAANQKSLWGFLASTTAAASRHNKALFKINQAAGIANAIISTNEGMAKALTYGPILGPVLAGVVAAAGAANILAIRSASFGGGGGSAPSVGPTSAAPVVATTPAGGGGDSFGGGGGGGMQVTIINHGVMSGEDDIKGWLSETIRDEIDTESLVLETNNEGRVVAS